MSSQNSTDDIKKWLKTVLSGEHLSDFTVDVVGNTEKGDGYSGDIIFVHVDAKTTKDKPKSYDLILKCGKTIKAIRDSVPIRNIYENEIYMYSRVFPAFEQFQVEKGIKDTFDSVPRYFGKVFSDTIEVVVLQNLKTLGYELHDRRKPMGLNQIKSLVREYGKWHALSGAMQDQRPEEFKELLGGVQDVWKQFMENTDSYKMFETPFNEMCGLLKEDGNQKLCDKLCNLKSEIDQVIKNPTEGQNCFSVLLHGDSWNNNFMFQYKEKELQKIAIVDWQMARLDSPVIDLSYFLYSAISKDNIAHNFEEILKEYYESFSNYVRRLGSDPEKIFSYSTFLEDWKKFGKYGIIMSLFVVKIAMSEKDEVRDAVDVMEKDGDIAASFTYNIKNKSKWKARIMAILEHGIGFGVI